MPMVRIGILVAVKVGISLTVAACGYNWDNCMKLKRTHDMELVAKIIGHPRIWPHIHEDGIEIPNPIDHEGFHWIVVDDGEPVGIFLLHQSSSHCWEMHTCLLPKIWGPLANKSASLLMEYVFGIHGCMKLITRVPAYNKSALRFAERNGMVQEGINRESFLKNGQLIDQIMLGMTLKEYMKCQQQSLSQQQ